MTLVELLLALSILAVIAAALAGMLATVSTGTRSATQLRHRNLRSEVARERIEASVRSSAAVLAVGDRWLVLWAGDTRPNSAPDLSEVRRIEWDAGTRELRCYAARPGLTDGENVAYTWSSDFGTITRGLAGTASFPGEVWARRVGGWAPALDAASPQQAKTVSYRLTLEDERGSTTFVATVAPRGS